MSYSKHFGGGPLIGDQALSPEPVTLRLQAPPDKKDQISPHYAVNPTLVGDGVAVSQR
jgi:hypothetical protein